MARGGLAVERQHKATQTEDAETHCIGLLPDEQAPMATRVTVSGAGFVADSNLSGLVVIKLNLAKASKFAGGCHLASKVVQLVSGDFARDTTRAA